MGVEARDVHHEGVAGAGDEDVGTVPLSAAGHLAEEAPPAEAQYTVRPISTTPTATTAAASHERDGHPRRGRARRIASAARRWPP